MRQLRFTKQDKTQGKIEVVMRIMERQIFFKFNNSQYANQVMRELRNKGAVVELGRSLKWIRVDMFSPFLKDSNSAKLGDITIDFDVDSPEQIENKIAVFYTGMYGKGGFKLE